MPDPSHFLRQYRRAAFAVENLLLYNLQFSAFAHLSGEEVVLTRSFAPPVAPADGDAGALV